MVKKLTTHIKVHIAADKTFSDQNSEVNTTCILTSLSAETLAELHAIYDDFKICGMVYGELFFKGLVNKAIVDNKQTTKYLQDQDENLPLYMTTCDSDIAKFIQ